MKRFFTVVMLAMALASCDKDKFEYNTGDEQEFGTLSFADLSIGVNEEVEYLGTRAATEADGSYKVIITNNTRQKLI